MNTGSHAYAALLLMVPYKILCPVVTLYVKWFLTLLVIDQCCSWNSWRSEFTLHGRWCSACEQGATPFTCCTPHHERETLAAIVYEKNYKGDCPRKFTAVVPSINRRGERVVFCPNQERRKDIIACFDSGDWGHLIPFVTKPPKWNEGATLYTTLLTFHSCVLNRIGIGFLAATIPYSLQAPSALKAASRIGSR